MARSAAGGASPHQLRIFVVLSEELHFGAAARRLFISQSALSQQLRALERNLGVALLDRGSRKVELTEAGHAVLGTARSVLRAYDELGAVAGTHARRIAGRLAVGFVEAELALPVQRSVVDTTRAQHPELDIDLLGLDFAGQFTALLHGEVDVVFLRPPAPEGISVQVLYAEPRVVCLPAEHRLAERESVELAELAGEPMITIPDDVPLVWRRFWAVDPRPDGSSVRYGPLAGNTEALSSAVATGEAIAFVPASVRDLFPRPGIRCVPVRDLAPCSAALGWLPKNRDVPTVRAIRSIAREHIELMPDDQPGVTPRPG